jgi:hypothetical protein
MDIGDLAVLETDDVSARDRGVHTFGSARELPSSRLASVRRLVLRVVCVVCLVLVCSGASAA